MKKILLLVIIHCFLFPYKVGKIQLQDGSFLEGKNPDYPEVALRVLNRLAQIVRNCDERIMDLSTLGAVQRVYVELLRLATPDSGASSQWANNPNPTQANVAARASTTRETVARVFSQLRKSGLISRKGKTLYVNDYPELELMADRLPHREGDSVSR